MILSIANLKKSYGKHHVLKGIDAQIEEPKTIALIGPNGAGKTTLLNCICNLIPTDTGEIKILGMDHKDPNVFKRVSFLKDSTVLYPYLTGQDHLEFIKRVQGLHDNRMEYVTKRVGVDSFMKRKVSTYSTGMKQKLLLSMAMMNQPKLLIMDEPLNGLDPTSIIETRDLINEIRDEGTAVLISSHTLSEIDLITNEVFFLDEGILYYEDLRLLNKKSEERYRERFGNKKRE